MAAVGRALEAAGNINLGRCVKIDAPRGIRIAADEKRVTKENGVVIVTRLRRADQVLVDDKA